MQVPTISVREGDHAHAVIDTTHKTIELIISTEMLTRTQTKTHTHRQMLKQANVIHIAKGLAKKRKEKKRKEGKKNARGSPRQRLRLL